MLAKLFPVHSETGSQGKSQKYGNVSLEGGQMGWFPSNLHHDELPSVMSRRTVTWNDGVLLSELVSKLLVDERGLVKQIDQFDDYGRPKGPPRLVLVGTEVVVKSRAQALNNIRLSLKTLRGIPNFPHIAFTAEELLEDSTCRHRLMRMISFTFNLPPISIEGKGEPPHLIARQRRIYARRSASAPPVFGRIGYPPIIPSSASNGASRIPPQQKRGHRPRYFQHLQQPPRWSNHAMDNATSSRNSSPNRLKSKQALRNSSPEPRQRGMVPQPTASFHRLSRQTHRSRSVSPPRSQPFPHQSYPPYLGNKPISSISSNSGTFIRSNNQSAREKVRAVEMQRERLKVQQRDRQGRRKSLLLRQDEIQQQRHKLSHNNENIPPENTVLPNHHSDDTNKSTRSHKSRMIDHIHGNLDLPKPREGGGSVAGASIISSPQVVSPTWMWQPPKPTNTELTSSKHTPLDPISTAQQSAAKDWLALLGLPLQDGEGGYFSLFDTRLDNSVSSALPLNSPPPLSLYRDRLRNGQLFLLLLCNLEPALAAHAQLPRLLQYLQTKQSQHNPLLTALETNEKALWLFKLRRCPPLPVHLLTQPELYVQGKKDAIWGLLFHIMQSYGPAEQALNSAQQTGALQPLPLRFNVYRRQSIDNQIQKQLAYTPQQRRQLDQSLLDWLENNDVLTEFMGHLPRPATILALESFIKDGSLLNRLLLLLGLIDAQGRRSSIKAAHTFSQAVANIQKSLTVFRGCRAMPPRFIYSGVEEEIARGNWDSILGLLEDIHLLHDRLVDWKRDPRRVQQQENVTAAALPAAAMPQSMEYPYLGPQQLFRHLEKPPASQDTSFAATITPSSSQQQQVVQSQRRAMATRNNVRLDASYLTGEDSVHHRLQDQATSMQQNAQESNTGTAVFQPVLDLRSSLLGGESAADSLDRVLASSDYSHSQQHEKRRGRMEQPSRRQPGSTRYAPSSTSPSPSPPLSNSQDRLDQPTRPSQETASSSVVLRQDGSVGTEQRESKKSNMKSRRSTSSERSSQPIIIQQKASAQPQPSGNSNKNALDDSLLAAVNAVSSQAIDEKQRLTSLTRWAHAVLHNDTRNKQSNSSSSSDNEEQFPLLVVSNLPQLGKLFTDGVLLARIVQRLERRIVPGLEMRPRTTAHRLQNVRRTLEMLAEYNRRIPMRTLSCEEDILNGDGAAVLALLEALHKAHPLFVQSR